MLDSSTTSGPLMTTLSVLHALPIALAHPVRTTDAVHAFPDRSHVGMTSVHRGVSVNLVIRRKVVVHPRSVTLGPVGASETSVSRQPVAHSDDGPAVSRWCSAAATVAHAASRSLPATISRSGDTGIS